MTESKQKTISHEFIFMTNGFILLKFREPTPSLVLKDSAGEAEA